MKIDNSENALETQIMCHMIGTDGFPVGAAGFVARIPSKILFERLAAFCYKSFMTNMFLFELETAA